MAENKHHHNSQRAGCSRWLVIPTLTLALVQLGAAVNAVLTPPEIAQQISLLLPLEFLVGLFWTGLAGLTGYRLWQQQPDATRQFASLFGGFTLYAAVRWLLFTRADYDRQRLPFLLIFSGLVLILTLVYVWNTSRTQTQTMEENPHGS